MPEDRSIHVWNFTWCHQMFQLGQVPLLYSVFSLQLQPLITPGFETAGGLVLLPGGLEEHTPLSSSLLCGVAHREVGEEDVDSPGDFQSGGRTGCSRDPAAVRGLVGCSMGSRRFISCQQVSCLSTCMSVCLPVSLSLSRAFCAQNRFG